MLAASEQAQLLHSYVVRYDSGFAPNPFYGVCTLATCKPDIRKAAKIGDWVIGTGSADRRIRRGGFLVYAMRVTEALTIAQYWEDMRFRRKRPNLRGSRKHSCGDNIYHWNARKHKWDQLDSYHSRPDGSANPKHVSRDTKVDRVLLSTRFAYFGGSGPRIPRRLRDYRGIDICNSGRGRRVIHEQQLIEAFAEWMASLGAEGYVSPPFDWAAR